MFFNITQNLPIQTIIDNFIPPSSEKKVTIKAQNTLKVHFNDIPEIIPRPNKEIRKTPTWKFWYSVKDVKKMENQSIKDPSWQEVIATQEPQTSQAHSNKVDQIAAAILRKAQKKRVTFSETSSVILIPTKQEFKDYKLTPILWYSSHEMAAIKRKYSEEVLRRFWGPYS